MAGPLEKWRYKGIQISAWETNNGGINYKIVKEYKPKDSPDWKATNSFFPEERTELLRMLLETVEWEKNRQEEPAAREIVTQGNSERVADAFNDDDIPF
jgi:hypothetical protein